MLALTLRVTPCFALDLGEGDLGDLGEPPVLAKACAFKLGCDVCLTTSLKDLGLLTVRGMELTVLARLSMPPKRRLLTLEDCLTTGEPRPLCK